MTPQTFRKRPIEVQAMQWNGINARELHAWTNGKFQQVDFEDRETANETGELYVDANGRWLPIETGEWVLQDAKGFYPCKPDIFEQTYGVPSAAMSFGQVLEALNAGRRVAREGWNGKGMYLFLVPGSTFTVEASRPMGKASPELVGAAVNYRPHIDLKTADGEMVPWVATQSDLLATDWAIV